MSFTENLAQVVSEQMERFETLNTYQLAGHTANLDFWISQASHALETLDGYEPRFRLLKSAQTEYVKIHQIILRSPTDPSDPYTTGPPDPPRRVPDDQRREARRRVVDATYRFLVRLCKADLITPTRLQAICQELDIGTDPSDWKKLPRL